MCRRLPRFSGIAESGLAKRTHAQPDPGIFMVIGGHGGVGRLSGQLTCGLEMTAESFRVGSKRQSVVLYVGPVLDPLRLIGHTDGISRKKRPHVCPDALNRIVEFPGLRLSDHFSGLFESLQSEEVIGEVDVKTALIGAQIECLLVHSQSFLEFPKLNVSGAKVRVRSEITGIATDDFLSCRRGLGQVTHYIAVVVAGDEQLFVLTRMLA